MRIGALTPVRLQMVPGQELVKDSGAGKVAVVGAHALHLFVLAHGDGGEGDDDIIFGASLSSDNTVVVRMLGHGGEKLHNSFKRIQKYLWLQDTEKQNA